jgi:acetyl esterase/lipase
MKNLLITLLLILTIVSGCASYDLVSNQSYDPTSVPYGVYDIYYPKGPLFGLVADTNTHSTVIAVHGGGWYSGDKTDMADVAQDLCALGYIVVSPNYRLTMNPTTGYGSAWPAQIEDLQKACAYFRNNAKSLRINTNNMAALGVSAGGNLATMLSVRPDPLNGGMPTFSTAVDLDGEQDMTQPGNTVMADFYDGVSPVTTGIMTYAMGHPEPWTQAELQNISPVFFAPNATPKPNLLIIHGQSDPNVYVANAGWIKEALAKNMGTSDVQEVIITGSNGVCHGTCWEVPVADNAMHVFLAKHLNK